MKTKVFKNTKKEGVVKEVQDFMDDGKHMVAGLTVFFDIYDQKHTAIVGYY